MPHDEDPGAGDPLYWAPEALYSGTPPDWRARRACDLYQLGSLTLFLLEGVNATAAMFKQMGKDYYPEILDGDFRGSFQDVLPHLRDGLDRTCEDIQEVKAGRSSKRVVEIVRELCEPDPEIRGHPKNRGRFVDRYGLERYISEFHLAALRARFELGKNS